MEKYYRVSDVNEILNKLAKEPAYYHDGESFYNGVCAVEGELMCLEPVELDESKVGKLMKAYVVWECAVIEYEERVRNMGVFSSEDRAKAAIKEYEEIAEAYKEHFEYNYEEFEVDTVWETIEEEDTTESFYGEPISKTAETVWESIQQMTKEELAEWLYANCEWISAEYGACSGANDSSDVLRLLDSAED